MQAVTFWFIKTVDVNREGTIQAGFGLNWIIQKVNDVYSGCQKENEGKTIQCLSNVYVT